MKVLIIIGTFLFSANLFAAEPVAVGVNKERLVLMTEILHSDVVSSLLDKFGNESFVFDGMNWVNSPSDLRFYNLKFKKFDIEMTEKAITQITTTCNHLIILRSGKIIGNEPRGCRADRSSLRKETLVQ